MFSIRNLIILITALVSLNCASIGRKWKSIISGQPEKTQTSGASTQPQSPSFSNQPNLMVGRERKYKRVTKDNFGDEQSLEENAGSLWKKEGQASYLFSQNNLRVMGDIVNVAFEGKVAENIDTKLFIIKQALARLEAPLPKPVPRSPASAKSDGKNAGNQAQASAPVPAETTPEDQKKDTTAGVEKNHLDPVPCRIVEKNQDGSYRVKGQQAIFVGRHEYKLMVTGIVHSDDISDGTISSSKLLDSKIDLVASNKEVKNEIPR